MGGSSKFDGSRGGDSGLESIHEGSMGAVENTCKGVNLLVKLPAMSLRASKFTKNELFHTCFSRILARF